jgi:hypothetical protein
MVSIIGGVILDVEALSKLNKINRSLNDMAANGATHGHLNKIVIDEISDNAGKLLYKGQEIKQDLTEINDKLAAHETQLNDIVSINIKLFGAKGDGVADDTSAIQSAINYCLANKCTVFIPFAKKEVYKITQILDFKNVPVAGNLPLGALCDSYTQAGTSTNSCLFLATATAQIKNMPSARNVGISSNRTFNNLSSVKFDNRPSIDWYNISIYHSGLHGIELPYGAIPLFLEHVDISRCKGYGIDIEGALYTGNPDADTNRVHIVNSHISYTNNHAIYYNATGGIFTVENTDISGTGEPTGDSGGAGLNTNAYAFYIAAKSGSNNICYSFKNLWLEANNNVFYLNGVLSSIEINNIKLKPYTNGQGIIFKLVDYIYGFTIANVKGTQQFMYFYDFDSMSVLDNEVVRTFEEKNNVSIIAINKRTVSANSFTFARKLGGYTLQTYPVGTVTGSGANGNNTYYNIDTAKLPNPRTPFVENSNVWIDAAGSATDISLYIGGTYAGEIQLANGTTITTNKSVPIGDGSLEFRVKKKIYLDGIYYQPTIGKA